MKQSHLSWLLMAAAVITACEKERVETEPAIEKAPYVYSVKATISSEDATRTDYDASGKFSWTAGDQISVLFNNGSENKFFTLTADAAGASATFTGTIDAGYTIGALDGTDDDAKIWALYPASENHTYADGTASFYVQPEVDFTVTGFSANIPMYDLLTAEGEFSFKNLACTYKFTVKNLDASINKVKFTVSNQETRGLSGLWPIDNSEKFINYNWTADGDNKRTLTYINNVTDGQAVFYVSCRYYGSFKPDITISDAESNSVLKQFTASTAQTPSNMKKVQPIALIMGTTQTVINAEDVTVKKGKTINIGATTNSTAAIEYVSGDTSIATVTSEGAVTGVSEGTTTITLSVPAVEDKFTEATKTINVTVTAASTSIIDIDGDLSDWDNISACYLNDGNSRIREIKFKSDSDNVYFCLKMRKNRAHNSPTLCIGFDTDNDASTGSSTGNIQGNEVRVEFIPFTNAGEGSQPVCVNGLVTNATINGTVDNSAVTAYMYDDGSALSSTSNIYLEVGIDRNKLTLPAAGASITIGCSYDWYVTDKVNVTLE